MAYRRDDIERVRAATDLVELVAEVTKVKRSGRSVMAICPFHQEKTPSLSVDGARGLYHCFGCGKGGDVFKWVEETQGLDFVDTLELLARRANIVVQRDPAAARQRNRRQEMVDAVAAAVDFYRERLRTASDGGPARAYLRSRGYDAGTVDRFALGFSPAGWDELVRHLKRARVEEGLLTAAGLAVRSSRGRLVDRFRGRVMFPIYDLRGDPVGFGARRLDGDGPKYLNSPETPLYHKSRLLYGLNWAKSEIVRAGEAVTVEGYTDVIALHEAGMPIAVATCGTALGESHFDLLRRFTERVVLAFDADEAGAGASLRGFEHQVPGNLDVRVARLPDGKDPADLVAAGDQERLRKAIEESDPLLQCRLERELERVQLTEPEARARAIRATAPLVASHPDPLARREYAVFLSRRTGVDLDGVVDAVESAARRAVPEPGAASSQPARRSGQARAERELLRALIGNDPGLRGVRLEASLLTDEAHVRAFEVLAPAVAALPPGESPDVGALAGEDGELLTLFSELTTSPEKAADAADVVHRLQVRALDRRIEGVERTLAMLDADADAEKYSVTMRELIALQRQRRDHGGTD